MERETLQDLYEKSVSIETLIEQLTINESDYTPTYTEYLSDIYIMINIYEYITSVLYEKAYELDTTISKRNMPAIKLYRVCRDMGLISNSDRNFMTSFHYVRNICCHKYQELTPLDLYTYTVTYKKYIRKMVNYAGDLLGADIRPVIHIHLVDLFKADATPRYQDILTSAMYTLNRILSLKECTEIKKLYSSGDATITNLHRLLMTTTRQVVNV